MVSTSTFSDLPANTRYDRLGVLLESSLLSLPFLIAIAFLGIRNRVNRERAVGIVRKNHNAAGEDKANIQLAAYPREFTCPLIIDQPAFIFAACGCRTGGKMKKHIRLNTAYKILHRLIIVDGDSFS